MSAPARRPQAHRLSSFIRPPDPTPMPPLRVVWRQTRSNGTVIEYLG